MKKAKTADLIDLIINVLVVILCTVAVSFFFTRDTLSVLGVSGTTCFCYFTIDANILAALSCLVQIPFCVKALTGGEATRPAWAFKLKYVGTVLLTLTMLVVVCYLIPVQGLRKMTASSNLYLHILCPPLVILSFLLLEKGKIKKRDALWSTGTVLIYAAVYLIMVVAVGPDKGGWPDFYNFNDNNTWPYFFAGIMVFTYLVSRLVCFVKSKIR